MHGLPDDLCDFKVYPVDLSDPNAQYFLLVKKTELLVKIIELDRKTKTWHYVYSEDLTNYGRVVFYNRRWDAVDKKVLVLSSPGMGTGKFISHKVLGEKRGKIVKYVSEDNIFQGSIFFEGYKLIRGTGNQFRVWKKANGIFVLEPYRMPKYPGAFKIKYFILNANIVRVEKTHYTVPVGSIVQLDKLQNGLEMLLKNVMKPFEDSLIWLRRYKKWVQRKKLGRKKCFFPL